MSPKERKDAYNLVTERIIEALEAGIVPWRQPWRSIGDGPLSLSTGKAYKGVNVFTLTVTAMLRGYTSPYWTTYKQAKERGGTVRKGETGTPVVFWKFIERENKETGETERIPFLRYFLVFNAEQCENLAVPTIEPLPEVDPIESAEQIQAHMPKRPTVKHGGDSAYYSPSLDYVQMPARAAFAAAEGYYQTLFHELTHSTAHESRLGRKTNGWTPFGTVDYSKEELVAEMGAAFLCGAAQIEPNYEQSASYIASWLKVLKDDRKMIVSAAGAAAKAASFILNEKSEEESTPDSSAQSSKPRRKTQCPRRSSANSAGWVPTTTATSRSSRHPRLSTSGGPARPPAYSAKSARAKSHRTTTHGRAPGRRSLSHPRGRIRPAKL